MCPSAPIIALLIPTWVAACMCTVGCGGPPKTILESDVPNVVGMEPIVTRDIVRREGEMVGVHVIYRGDVVDCQVIARETRAAFDDQGWWFMNEQARGTTTVLTFGKEQRRVRIEIAENQIDPMMSPATLQLSLAGAAPATSTTSLHSQTGGQPSSSVEGFAPPPK